MANVLVTGGAGFIGSHMVDFLIERDNKVRVIDNLISGKPINLLQHKNNKNLILDERDIRDVSADDSIYKELDYIYHFAGIGDIVPSIDKPLEYMSVNTQGTVKVCEGARHNNIKKLVYAASSSCYGLAKVPTDEKAQISIQYPYALSKYLGECSVLHWHKVYGLPVNVIRIFNAYGTRSKTGGSYGAVFGVFLKQKLSNKSLTVVGNGQQTRDFIDVSDVVNALIKSMNLKTKKNYIFNIGSSNPVKILDLVKIIGGKYINIPKRPGEPNITHANIKEAKRILRWSPKVSFNEGMSILIKNINYWKEAPLWTKNKIKIQTKNWFKFLK